MALRYVVMLLHSLFNRPVAAGHMQARDISYWLDYSALARYLVAYFPE